MFNYANHEINRLQRKCECHPHLFNDAKRSDPTNTLSIRNAFERALVAKFKRIKQLINQAIVQNDVFGLKKRAIGDALPNMIMFDASVPSSRAFAFARSSDKVAEFMDWLRKAEEELILELIPGTSITSSAQSAWTNTYIDTAYQKGIRDAAAKMKREGANIEQSWISSSFNRPVHADRLGLIYTRAYSDLDGITRTMDQQISRILAQAIGEGRGPMDIARELNERVDKIGITRARMLARTEVISAHAEASINAYEEAEIEGLDVEAEVLNGSDPCPECQSLADRGPYTISEARGLIPAHPNAVFEGSTFVSYGECLEIVRARYRGPSVILSCDGGQYRTTIGPNHPMLTSRGFVKAAEINKGDKILYDLRHERSMSSPALDLDKIPLCEDTFKSCVPVGMNTGVAASSSDLHGDRQFCYGEVEAIRPANGLLKKFDTGITKEISENLLIGSDPYSHLVARLASSLPAFDAVNLTASGGMSSPDIGIGADYVWLIVHEVEFSEFDGWAFDYSTASSLYCNNGFVVKNCVCSLNPKVVNGSGINLI